MRAAQVLASLVLALAAGAAPASGPAARPGAWALGHSAPHTSVEPDVVYVPTPQAVVEAMLRLARVGPGDLLYDLGSGDGRIPVTAAKLHGIRAVGIDIDPERVAEATANAKAEAVSHLVRFRTEDMFEADFREASVVTLYLLPELNVKLRPRLLAQLKPGTRIVSHQFGMGRWKPEQTRVVEGRLVHLWTVPAPRAPRKQR